MNNNNEIKGKDYYFISYQPKILSGESQYRLPFVISDVGAIGTSIIYNDNNISIFQLKVIQILCPIMIQKKLKVIYIYLIKKFRNIQSIIFINKC